MPTVEFAHKLTPRLERILLAASSEAERRGHTYIGTEHIFWALIADPNAVPTQVLESAGIRTSAVQEVERIIANSAPSDLVLDRDGNVIGHMTMGPNGKARIVDDDGNEVPLEPYN